MTQDNLSEDASQLLMAGEQSGEIECMEILGSGGTLIAAGGQNFTDGTPRSVARWRVALQQLENGGFIERTGQRRPITHKGFQKIDALKVSGGC